MGLIFGLGDPGICRKHLKFEGCKIGLFRVKWHLPEFLARQAENSRRLAKKPILKNSNASYGSQKPQTKQKTIFMISKVGSCVNGKADECNLSALIANEHRPSVPLVRAQDGLCWFAIRADKSGCAPLFATRADKDEK